MLRQLISLDQTLQTQNDIEVCWRCKTNWIEERMNSNQKCTWPMRGWALTRLRLPSIIRSGALGAMIVLGSVGAPVAVADVISSLPRSKMSAELDLEKQPAEVAEACLSFEKRDFDGCLKHLEKAAKAHPELVPAPALFAKLASLYNQPALIRPALERAVVQAPEHPEIFILFGNLALLENRATDASVHFEKASKLAAAARWTADQRSRFERLCHQGNAQVAESRGNWDVARAELEAWLKQQPKNAQARQRLGKVLFRLNSHDLAYNEFKKAAKDDAAIDSPEIMMGWLHTSAGQLDKAEKWMNLAIKSSPESLPVRMGVFSWLLEQGRGDEAQTQADAAAEMKSNSSPTSVKRMLGMAARARKDYGNAEENFQSLVTESPADAWARNQLALVLVEQPDEVKQRRALELAELSVRQDSNSIEALETLGIVYYRLKRLDEAERLLQSVFNSGRANSDAAYFLALVKSERSQPEAAPVLLKTALNAPGLFVFRKDAQEWFDRLQK